MVVSSLSITQGFQVYLTIVCGKKVYPQSGKTYTRRIPPVNKSPAYSRIHDTSTRF